MEKGTKPKNLCNTCREEIAAKGTIFSCPGCGKSKIVRCFKCRKLASQYTCEKCGFVGP